jgi:hypothetical protein
MQVALRTTLALVFLAASSACSGKSAAPPEAAIRSDSNVAAVPPGGAQATAARPPADAKAYGKPLTLTETTPVSVLLKDPRAYQGKRVLVQGPIVEVCAERGCWIRIASEKDFAAIRFKVQDGVIVFPLTAKGKTALAEGVISVTELTREQAIAQARETAKERGTLASFDPAKITGPATDVVLNGEGARIW